MKKIPVTQILDGMTLAQPVFGPGGNVLIGQGSLLKASLCGRLSSWGVTSVWIESDETELQPQVTPLSVPSAKQRIDFIFEGRLVNPAMKMIYHAILEQSGCDYDT